MVLWCTGAGAFVGKDSVCDEFPFLVEGGPLFPGVRKSPRGRQTTAHTQTNLSTQLLNDELSPPYKHLQTIDTKHPARGVALPS